MTPELKHVLRRTFGIDAGRRPARPVRGRPWKADGAHRPSWQPDALRYMSVDTATQRFTAVQGGT
jgi:hypothetical protein